MLIAGNKLNQAQRKQVLNAFLYRWTIENKEHFRNYRLECIPTIPPVTDDQWITEHAFHFVADGSRLMFNRHHAEPAFMAQPDEHASQIAGDGWESDDERARR